MKTKMNVALKIDAAMPTKMRVLFGLLAGMIAIDVLLFVLFRRVDIANFLMTVLLTLGLWYGKEGARNIMQGIAMFGLSMSGFGLVMGVTTASSGIFAVAFTTIGLFGMFYNGFAIWCLNQGDVQDWMLMRSFNEI